MKGIDPANIFRHALAALRSDQALVRMANNDPSEDDPYLQQPALVLRALATELFLKCLMTVDHNDTPIGHDCYDLFLGLRPETINRIEALWADRSKRKHEYWDALDRSASTKVPRELHAALKQGRRTFEFIRYAYEPRKNGAKPAWSVVHDVLPGILRDVSVEKRPEWSAL